MIDHFNQTKVCFFSCSSRGVGTLLTIVVLLFSNQPICGCSNIATVIGQLATCSIKYKYKNANPTSIYCKYQYFSVSTLYNSMFELLFSIFQKQYIFSSMWLNQIFIRQAAHILFLLSIMANYLLR